MKKVLLTTLAATTLSGCLGHNALFNTVQDWNATASDEKFVNQGISFAFWIFPVYGLTLFADVIVFNSIEFWTGTNPINNKGPRVSGATQHFNDGEGNHAQMTYNEDGSVSVVTTTATGEISQYTLVKEGQTVVRQQNDGTTEVVATTLL